MSPLVARRGGTLVLVGVGIVAAFLAAAVLDHVPWLLPWTIAAVLLTRVTGRTAGRGPRPVRLRAPIALTVAGLIMALVVWGGPGLALNRQARRQLRTRPTAAITAYVRQHAPRGHLRTRHQRRRAEHRRRVLTRSPAARLYGIRQLGDWHWQRLIAGISPLLGGPLALWGIAAGLGLARRRRRRTRSPAPPGVSLAEHGQAQLRTAGRRR